MILQFSFLFYHACSNSSILSITAISLSISVVLFDFNIILPLWIIFNQVKSEQFISLTAVPFHRKLQLINYQDLTQDTLFIWLDLSIMKLIHNGKMM